MGKKVGESSKAKVAKANITIGDVVKINKEMPRYVGKGSKYNFIETMEIGECLCLPKGSTNVSVDILKRAITGAAKRRCIKVICSVEAEGFCIWRKS